MSASRVLAIGGLDPTGGAGLAVDARMAAALDVHALTVASCLTVQNRYGFRSLEPVRAELLAASLDAAIADGPVGAVKLGLMPDGATLRLVVAHCAAALPAVPLVVDPVLGATSGGLRSAPALVAAYREVLDRVYVLTPNLPELAQLAGDAGVAALLGLGCTAVLVKGGHAPADAATLEDRLVTADEAVTFRHPRLPRGPIHGTGCALATALAARLANGEPLAGAAQGAVGDLGASIERTGSAADGRSVPLVVRARR